MQVKKEIRKEALTKRDALTVEERMEKSHEIMDKVVSHREFGNADKVLLFASYLTEVDTSGIMEYAFMLGKKVYFPKINGDDMEFYKVNSESDLVEGYRGIREPEANQDELFEPLKGEKIFVLMPGAAFDKSGGRIGYGKGFYDKFLHKTEAEIEIDDLCKMAVAFECQLVEEGQIEKQIHDISPDYLVTEKNLYIV